MVNSRYSSATGVLWLVSRPSTPLFIEVSKPPRVNPSPKASAGIHVPSKSAALYKSCPDCFFTRILTPSDCSSFAKSAKFETFGSILAMRSRINSCSAALAFPHKAQPVNEQGILIIKGKIFGVVCSGRSLCRQQLRQQRGRKFRQSKSGERLLALRLCGYFG